MTFKVHMLANHDPYCIREVVIPDTAQVTDETSQATLLDLVFYYGQNEFQPLRDRYSVSCGDVIELHDGSLHVVASVGFKQISPEQFEKYKLMERLDRSFAGYTGIWDV